ncbi:hypothetical protein GCM10009639_20780 [Kitasatospora putterlickiae]|uniref:Uncharacterized protein n=1 Tax=Kitasatospora putterlickiae TaxID=221725 RepID=A0ABP4IHT9_9ACTN
MTGSKEPETFGDVADESLSVGTPVVGYRLGHLPVLTGGAGRPRGTVENPPAFRAPTPAVPPTKAQPARAVHSGGVHNRAPAPPTWISVPVCRS